jgi:OFA family oxalate/formate antiporter-like MFS transporter
LTLSLGTVHGFSVLIEPLEDLFELGRTATSLFYSLSLVCLTIAVLFSPRLLHRWSPLTNSLITCSIGALGCGIAALADTPIVFAVGYGVLFGSANGLGYALALQLAAQAYPNRRGLTIGTVTALYGLGASFFAICTGLASNDDKVGGAMVTLSVLLGLVLLVNALLLNRARTIQEATPSEQMGRRTLGLQIRLWIGYLTTCIAGLMVLGHAATILMHAGGTQQDATRVVFLVGATTAAGGLAAGWLNDRVGRRVLMIALPIFSAITLVSMTQVTGQLMILALGMTGAVYGATITVFPSSISRIFGLHGGVIVYGRIMTAWGLAGLVGPALAGMTYDITGSYSPALYIAAVGAIVAIWSINNID